MKKILALAMAMLLALGMMSTVASAEGEKKLIYPIGGDPQQMDPSLNSYSRSSSVLKQLFVGLYKVGPDGKTLVPALAESHTKSDDGLQYVFTLREGLKWSDGSPLTAADFEYAWKRVLDPNVASKAVSDMYILKNGAEYNKGEASADDVGVKALDERTLQVDLVASMPWFLQVTASTGFYPVKKEVVEAGTAENPWTANPETYLCTGPFMLKSYSIKEKLELVKNPNYYDAAAVALDAVDIVIVPDSNAELVAYRNGEIDVADNINAEALEAFRETPEYGAVYILRVSYADFNCVKAPFDNKLVRQAFSMSFDRQLLVDRIMKTRDLPLMSFVPYVQPSVTDPSKSYRDVAGDLFAYDVEKANALLDEAGYTDRTTFPKIELVIQADPTANSVAQAMQAMWVQGLGLTIDQVQIKAIESSAFWDELDAGNFDIDANGYTGDFDDPLANLRIYGTGSNAYENQWPNRAAYDAILNKLVAETDPAAREALMIECEKMLADEMPVAPKFAGVDDFVAKPYVHGFIKNDIGHPLLEYVTMDDK